MPSTAIALHTKGLLIFAVQWTS